MDKGVLSGLFNCDHAQSQFGSTLREVMKHALAIAFFEIVLPLIGVFLAFGEHGWLGRVARGNSPLGLSQNRT